MASINTIQALDAIFISARQSKKVDNLGVRTSDSVVKDGYEDYQLLREIRRMIMILMLRSIPWCKGGSCLRRR